MYKKAMAMMVGAYVVLFVLYLLKMDGETFKKMITVKEEIGTCVDMAQNEDEVNKHKDYEKKEGIGIVRYSSSNERIVECGVLIQRGEEEEYEEEARLNPNKEKEAGEWKEITSFSEDEIEVLERIVEAEAGGEDEKGKLLVANVVLNRVQSDVFPNTISEVVFQRSNGVTQFSPVKNGRYESVVVSEETINAVKRALQGEDASEGALFFAARKHANPKSMRWFDENLSFLFKHGGHEFFK